MKKASEYRMHAEECRALASGMEGAQRSQLLEMAATWDKLAIERADLVRRHPELALKGERGEETGRPPESPHWPHRDETSSS
jgi:hypothetical protein